MLFGPALISDIGTPSFSCPATAFAETGPACEGLFCASVLYAVLNLSPARASLSCRTTRAKIFCSSACPIRLNIVSVKSPGTPGENERKVRPNISIEKFNLKRNIFSSAGRH